MQYSISIIIPAFNDSYTPPHLIKETENVLKTITLNYEILVIDDASHDNTQTILRKIQSKKLKLWFHHTNKGHGITLKELYHKASKQLIFSLPGNGQIKPSELKKLLPHIYEYDMVIGARKLRHVPFRRKIQSKIYNLLIHTLYGLELSDVNSIRLMKKSALGKIKLVAKTSFVDAEMCYKFIKNGFKIIEVPITHTQGPSRGGGSLKTIIPTLTESLTLRTKF